MSTCITDTVQTYFNTDILWRLDFHKTFDKTILYISFIFAVQNTYLSFRKDVYMVSKKLL